MIFVHGWPELGRSWRQQTEHSASVDGDLKARKFDDNSPLCGSGIDVVRIFVSGYHR